jgi:hypothetical protein
MPDLPPDLVRPAVEAARRALRELDDDEVPASLRTAAASSDRRLPAPVAGRVVRELEASGWLRERALERWPAADPEDRDPAAAASALFLLRPDGWEDRFSRLVAEFEAERRRRSAAAERRKARRTTEELETLHRRLDELRAESDRRVAEAVRTEAARGERVARRNAELEAEVARLGRAVARAEAEIAELAAELSEADLRIEALRRAAGRGRPRPGPVAGEGGAWSWVRGRPAELARSLDQLVAAILAPPEEESRRPEAAGPVGLPDGIRPDRPEAVDWLLGLELPVSLVVDGYNVIHHLGGTPDAVGRDHLERGLSRIRRLAEAPVRVTVVYDSATEVSTHQRAGLEIRFVPNADEEVRATAATAPGIVVVASSDRAVREGVDGRSVVGLWSEAVAGWIGRRR